MRKQGGRKKQLAVHRYVLSETTGLRGVYPEIQNHTNIGLFVAVCSSATIIASAALWDIPQFTAGVAVFSVLISALPISRLVLELLLQQTTRGRNLLARKLFIGNKEYLVPDNGEIDSNLGLFAAAYRSIQTEQKGWQDHHTISELPGVGVSIGEFGTSGKHYAFFYGRNDVLLDNSKELWDLDHVREISTKDRQRTVSKLSAWKRQHLMTMSLGYVPLEQETNFDLDSIGMLANSLTYLGSVGLHSSREQGQTYAFHPASVLRFGSLTNLLVTATVSFVIVFSCFINAAISTPIALGLSQIIMLCFTLVPIICIGQIWNHAVVAKKISERLSVRSVFQSSLLIVFVTLVNYLLFYSRYNVPITGVMDGSLVHRGAMAATFLTLGLCVISFVIIGRRSSGLPLLERHNPVFLLSLSLALLVLVVGAYLTGPLAASDLFASAIAAGVFVVIRLLVDYANTHHPRSKLLELLQSSS